MHNEDKKEHSALISTPNSSALQSRSVSLAKRGLKSLQTLGRTVLFPSDIPFGYVYLFDQNSDVFTWFENETRLLPHRIMPVPDLGFETVGRVRGHFRVPSGKKIALRIGQEDKPLSLLSSFAPDSISAIFVDGPVVGKESIRLSHLTGVEFLCFSWCKRDESRATDLTLAQLSNLTSLRSLDLRTADVTDDGLSNLSSLTSLSRLDLRSTNITGKGFANLADLKALKYLVLSVNHTLTDEGLFYVSKIKGLEHLELDNTHGLTDVGFSHLANLPSLSHLNLNYTKITNDGLSFLSTLTSLTHLDLSITEVTDDGLRYLSTLKSLKKLDLEDTEVSERGVQELRASLPDCEIIS